MTEKKHLFENILTELYGPVGVIVFNRPQSMNALSTGLIHDLHTALKGFEQDKRVGAIVLTGSRKAFAAGADIKELEEKTFLEVYQENLITNGWEAITESRKPTIAAVAGYALGGGCEIAMMCDFIIAAENAKFGQPEVSLGTMPGAGGTQRLTRIIGKSKAMDMCLTGRLMDAKEAEQSGLVSRILPLENFLDEVIQIAHTVARMSRTSTMMIKESINTAYETSLHEGLRFERRLFHATFATPDQKEGMKAFLEKRPPKFH